MTYDIVAHCTICESLWRGSISRTSTPERAAVRMAKSTDSVGRKYGVSIYTYFFAFRIMLTYPCSIVGQESVGLLLTICVRQSADLEMSGRIVGAVRYQRLVDEVPVDKERALKRRRRQCPQSSCGCRARQCAYRPCRNPGRSARQCSCRQ